MQDDESKVEWFQRRRTPKPRKVNLKKLLQFSTDLIHFFLKLLNLMLEDLLFGSFGVGGPEQNDLQF